MQSSKTIYFPDYPSSGVTRSGLTIPFSADDGTLFESVRPLSSHTIRAMIGFSRYGEIESAATKVDAPIASFVRELIRGRSNRNPKAKNSQFYAIQSTFRGGKGSPLHDWYPYLEGYSPEFVSNVIETFAPQARNILDPFCGSGTTALVAALRGGIGYYAEVNPVCQFVIEAKAMALTLDVKERQRVASKLAELCVDISATTNSSSPDASLSRSFSETFGERPFFDEQNFEKVLRMRSLIDKLDSTDPVTSRFFMIGALRSLVPSSLLVRRGDLRFRSAKELEKGVPRYVNELKKSLELISSDLMDSEAAPGRTHFVCSDARTLPDRMDNQVDAIITSPPYLNGTNYFRNTKIELWFLRKLKKKSDLRVYRDAAVTSGINDVTRKKLMGAKEGALSFTSDRLERTLRDLNDTAYDSRIPAMAENYFIDMNRVLSAFPKVLKSDGSICIDLGDSVYGGVHVPTHEILAELMDQHGYYENKLIVLRERQSRGGTRLSQTLQVFKSKNKARAVPSSTSNKKIMNRWNRFKVDLPHQKGDMAKRNWGHTWHSMCSYQGKLKPSIAKCLVDALMPSGPGRLLDTFSGVGTIPFEARLAGHTAFGFDISPAAIAISRGKLEQVDWSAVDDILKKLAEYINAKKKNVKLAPLATIRFNGPLPDYFHPDTLKEIVAARRFFLENRPDSGAGAIVMASLLHILHGNRPYALSRRSHPITPFAPTGPAEYRSLMERLHKKVDRCRVAAEGIPDTNSLSFAQDVTKTWPTEVTNLDAIITSPPFFDSTRFHTANWMRLWFAGWEPKDFSKKPADFVDEKQKSSFELYDRIFQQAHERLKAGGMFAVHVGKSKKCDMAAALQQVGERHLHFKDWFSESVEHCESHGIRDKGTVTHHQYLLFEKTA